MKTKVLIIGAEYICSNATSNQDKIQVCWQGYEGNNLELAFDILQDKLSGGYLEEERKHGNFKRPIKSRVDYLRNYASYS